MATHPTAPNQYKRFLVFQYDQYYPSGAMGDVLASYDTLDEVKAVIAAEDNMHDFHDVLDLEERRWVEITP